MRSDHSASVEIGDVEEWIIQDALTCIFDAWRPTDASVEEHVTSAMDMMRKGLLHIDVTDLDAFKRGSACGIRLVLKKHVAERINGILLDDGSNPPFPA